MIERGREIVMEKVVFDQKPGHQKSDARPARAPEKPLRNRSVRQEQVIEKSFIVNPATRPDGLSYVTWWSASDGDLARQHRCWSNIDWSLFGTGLSFVSHRIRYTLICLPGSLPENMVESLAKPPGWLLGSSQRPPAFHLVSSPRARRYRPDPTAHRFMRDLHRHVANHRQDLRTDLEERKQARETRKKRREASKQQPKDLVIRYGLKPLSALEEEDPSSTRANPPKR